MTAPFKDITLVAVNGLADVRGSALALQWSLEQMPGARAVLCSPNAPDDLHPAIQHARIAPLSYQDYSWFVLFALSQVVKTEFALIVQDDGWVLDGANWQPIFFDFDYIGAPTHLARIRTADTNKWSRMYQWINEALPPGASVLQVQNGGFSLRSQRLMQALVQHRHIQVHVPPPDGWRGDPPRMSWVGDDLNEDVQLTAVLRPQLEAVGIRFAPFELASCFSIEHAAPALHHGFDLARLFGHHASLRKLVSLHPKVVQYRCTPEQVGQIYGEIDIAHHLERLGYSLRFA